MCFKKMDFVKTMKRSWTSFLAMRSVSDTVFFCIRNFKFIGLPLRIRTNNDFACVSIWFDRMSTFLKDIWHKLIRCNCLIRKNNWNSKTKLRIHGSWIKFIAILLNFDIINIPCQYRTYTWWRVMVQHCFQYYSTIDCAPSFVKVAGDVFHETIATT
jgi:hypothetical protein